MKHGSLLTQPSGRRRHVFAATAVAVVATVLGVSVIDGSGSIDRPGRPAGDLAEQLDALRGANDLVRASRADVGRDPALYPTAYGRMEAAAALPEGRRSTVSVPEIQVDALADLARTDLVDSPAWRAHYVCLSLPGTKSDDATTVLDRAGIRDRAESEALAYLRDPDSGDDALTSLTTRAAFLQTLACLGRADEVPRAAVDRLAGDTAQAEQPVPVFYAVEALRAVGERARATRALRDADSMLTADCSALDPIQRAALALLRQQSSPRTRDCLLPALRDPDPQTRWLVRRALTLGGVDGDRMLPAPVGTVRSDGLVAKLPAQLGTLTATYNAARALTAGAQQGRAPQWLTKRLKRLGRDSDLEPSDRILLAMTCHRLSLACGAQADKGAKEAAELEVPVRLTEENQRRWYGVMAARAEFGMECQRTSVELPAGEYTALSSRSLDIVVVLAHAECVAQVRQLTEGTDLVLQVRKALRNGDLLTASDAVQAALASDQDVPQSLWDEIPNLLQRYRDAKYPDLYAASPGGVASAEATRAAYYLLA
jgi:hypothetical protein